MLHHCSHHFHVPYTPTLTVFGVVIGIIEKTYVQANNIIAGDENHAGQTDETHTTTPMIVTVQENFRTPAPEIVFLIFLPALIFESAFNSDWYTFKR